MDMHSNASLHSALVAPVPLAGTPAGAALAPAPRRRLRIARLLTRLLPPLLKARLHRALGHAPQTTPLQQLADRVKKHQAHGVRTLELCIDLGLQARARQALSTVSPGEVRELTRIKLALLCGDTAQALSRAATLQDAATSPACTSDELAEAVDLLAPLSPQAALTLILRRGLRHAAEPALLLALGYAASAGNRAQALGSALGPERWLLQANLQGSRATSGVGLNRYLEAHGLAPLTLADERLPAALNNLRRQGPVPRATNQALLSVVMTAYQASTHIEAALRSVLTGDHQALELIVIDDGSSDDTWSRIQAVAAADSRVRPVRLARNVGTYAAKNVGLAMAVGEFAAFQDADDLAHPERFTRCLAALQADPAQVAVSSHYVRLADDGTFHARRVWPLTRWTPNSIVFRRQTVLVRIGFFDENRFGADSEYAARLVAAFGRKAHRKLAQPLTIAAHRPSSLMTASTTGIDSQGQSRVRSAYQEAWTEALLQQTLRGVDFYRPAVLGTSALTGEPADSPPASAARRVLAPASDETAATAV